VAAEVPRCNVVYHIAVAPANLLRRAQRRSGPAPHPLERLGYQPLQQLAYEKIRQGIMSGTFRPGEPLSIRGLAASYGVSSIPVREAMRRLEAEGLLHFSPNKGVRVNQLSRADLEEVFLIRLQLETLALKLALKNITPAQLDQLESLLQQMKSSIGDNTKWSDLHHRFHFLVYEAAQRPRLYRIISGLWSVMAPYFGVYVRGTRDLANAHAEHIGLFRSLRASDATAAEQVLVKHMTSTHDAVVEQLGAPSIQEPALIIRRRRTTSDSR
jgi:DNA-binding GntR family transcriptional regulator